MIRPFEDKDANRCREIIRECFDKSVSLSNHASSYVKKIYTEKGYLENKSKEYQFFILEKNNEIVGFGGLKKNNIKKIYVDPNHQGEGIGATLLNYLEDLASKQGQKELILYAYDNSVPFYKKHGYTVTEPFIFQRNGVDVPTVKMKKYLQKV